MTKADIPVLLSMGKEHLYVWEKTTRDAARGRGGGDFVCHLPRGEHLPEGAAPKEGKIELIAACDGLFRIEREGLRAVNALREMMIAAPYWGLCREERGQPGGHPCHPACH